MSERILEIDEDGKVHDLRRLELELAIRAYGDARFAADAERALSAFNYAVELGLK